MANFNALTSFNWIGCDKSCGDGGVVDVDDDGGGGGADGGSGGRMSPSSFLGSRLFPFLPTPWLLLLRVPLLLGMVILPQLPLPVLLTCKKSDPPCGRPKEAVDGHTFVNTSKQNSYGQSELKGPSRNGIGCKS